MGSAFGSLRELALQGGDLDAQRSLIADGLAAHGVSAEGVAAVMPHVLDAVVLLELGDDGRRSRIGGQPRLPPDAEWPLDPDGKPLTFIASLDLAELPSLPPLPDDGPLLVYWSERFHEFDRMDFRAATRVHWVPGGVAPVDASKPREAKAYDPVPLTGVLMPVLGGRENVTVADADEDPLYDAADELLQLYDHQLLGASRDIQGPVLDEIPYWFEQGFPASREDFSPEELAGEGWLLLAEIESTGELMFGDVGALYLVIPEADLEARRFDRVLGIMQC